MGKPPEAQELFRYVDTSPRTHGHHQHLVLIRQPGGVLSLHTQHTNGRGTRIDLPADMEARLKAVLNG